MAIDTIQDVCHFVIEHHKRFRQTMGVPRSTFQFLIIGSYPAHVKMAELSLPNPIKYNDIDIMHKDEEFARFIAGKEPELRQRRKGQKHREAEELRAVQYVPFREDMEINYVCLNATDPLEARIVAADINGVAVGFLVTVNYQTGQCEHRWVASRDFQDFLRTQTLAACNFRSLAKPKNALTTLIRLLCKAQESNINVVVPADQDIVDMCHGRAINLETIQKYGELLPNNRRIIDRLLFFSAETHKKHNTQMLRFFSRSAAPEIPDDASSSLPSCHLALSSIVHHQIGGTCYANAIATAVCATENRIVGRVPMPHETIVKQIIAAHGSDGANTLAVLKEECDKR
eukprot:gb/GFBE01066050.1/.p1 GENE.gb/GFBE01066050.1/~~gb/GFBE01066050.1/.p1  ORF type:complete len:344 (+),score=56.43 gb/GFBE01066050.1/:1-1032(+)